MTEEWRPIPGYEGRYDVSDHGNVRSWIPYRSLPLPRLRTQTQDRGYFSVMLYDAQGAHRLRRVHQLVALAFHGPPPFPDAEVRHLDGTRDNNRAGNLLYGSRSENALDSVRHGTNFHTRKTHCPKGHEFDAEYETETGRRRRCLVCQRARHGAPTTCRACGLVVRVDMLSLHRRRRLCKSRQKSAAAQVAA